MNLEFVVELSLGELLSQTDLDTTVLIQCALHPTPYTFITLAPGVSDTTICAS